VKLVYARWEQQIPGPDRLNSLLNEARICSVGESQILFYPLFLRSIPLKDAVRGMQVNGRRLDPDVRHAGVQRVATISRCPRCIPSIRLLEEVGLTSAVLRFLALTNLP
jgi:hypothetical protein